MQVTCFSLISRSAIFTPAACGSQSKIESNSRNFKGLRTLWHTIICLPYYQNDIAQSSSRAMLDTSSGACLMLWRGCKMKSTRILWASSSLPIQDFDIALDNQPVIIFVTTETNWENLVNTVTPQLSVVAHSLIASYLCIVNQFRNITNVM